MVPVRCISSIRHMYTTDFAYDGPIFLVPLSPSYPSSPVPVLMVFAGGISGFKSHYSSPALYTYAAPFSVYHFNRKGGLLGFLAFLHRDIDLKQETFSQLSENQNCPFKFG